MVANFYLETERLIIKKGTVEDYVKIHEYDFNSLQNINGIFEYIKLNPDEVRSWFNNNIEDWYKKVESQKHYEMVVYLKETNEPIADIGFDRNNEEINSIEISCWLHPSYWGNGYMKEALECTMDYIFKQGFDNIIYGYVEENRNSKRLCEKLMFLPYKISENTFKTNSGLATKYENIMSKERFYDLYKKNKNK
jgi:ribosomal-protein-alanine N-acetyltransferase